MLCMDFWFLSKCECWVSTSFYTESTILFPIFLFLLIVKVDIWKEMEWSSFVQLCMQVAYLEFIHTCFFLDFRIPWQRNRFVLLEMWIKVVLRVVFLVFWLVCYFLSWIYDFIILVFWLIFCILYPSIFFFIRAFTTVWSHRSVGGMDME